MTAAGSWKGNFSLLLSSLQAQNSLLPCCKVSSRSTTTSRVTRDPFCPQTSQALSAGGRSSKCPCSSCENIGWFSFKTRHKNLPCQCLSFHLASDPRILSEVGKVREEASWSGRRLALLEQSEVLRRAS